MTAGLDSEIAGYRVERVLGRGGMSVVYLAEQPRLGRKVALKVLSPELSRDPAFRDRFSREWSLAAALEHPHVVQIYDAGEADGVLYMAMRFVDGTSLSSVLRAEGSLDPSRALGIIGQIAEALDAAHAREVIHGDVKPGNILIATTSGTDGREHCFLVDFGIARRPSSWLGLTEQGRLMGTIDYMPPEVIEEGGIDAQTDQYSLGCVLYECLTGSPPFPRTSDVAVAYAHLEDPPPLVTDRRPELLPEIDAVIAKALAKEKADRFGSCSSMVEAAGAALARAVEVPEVRKPSPIRMKRRRRKPLRRLAALASIMALVAAGVLLYRAFRPAPAGLYAHSQIFAMNADGTGQHQVLTGGGYDRAPSFSPDGTQFAFGSARTGDEDVYVINADGTGLTDITNDPATDGQASWSRQGDRIAFVSDREDGNDEIYVMMADGTGVTRLTFNPGADDDPTWSPDGETIAFVSDRTGNEDIYVMDAEGGHVQNLTERAGVDVAPSWSSDGDRIAFASGRASNREIYVMNADGTRLRRLTFDPSPEQSPAWSPDGESIAFVSSREGSRDIFVMNLTGTSISRLTRGAGDEFNPVWSPTGQIFYLAVPGRVPTPR